MSFLVKDWLSWCGFGNLGIVDGVEYFDVWDVVEGMFWSIEFFGMLILMLIVWGDCIFLML